MRSEYSLDYGWFACFSGIRCFRGLLAYLCGSTSPADGASVRCPFVAFTRSTNPYGGLISVVFSLLLRKPPTRQRVGNNAHAAATRQRRATFEVAEKLTCERDWAEATTGRLSSCSTQLDLQVANPIGGRPLCMALQLASV